jgi:DNA-directed RNA polymerase subunit RPC12/RpoP
MSDRERIPIAKPVVKEPTVTKAPPAGRKFPCPSCGARLDFDPSSRGLKCPYCGFEQKISRGDPDDVAERDYDDYLDREESHGRAIPGRSSETRCPGCGANVLLEDNVATTTCPFCLTHLEAKPEAAHAMIPPESLLPFAVDLRDARDSFTAWIGSLWFAPTELKKVATLGQLTGVYIPYWTYDANTVTFYDGERGDNYTDTETYTDSNGRTQTRTVIRTRWYPVSGEVRHFFDDVLVCASASLPADLIDRSADWNLNKLEPFVPDFLSGFRTERYSVNLRGGYKRAKELMEPTIYRLICQDIGGDHQRVHSKRTRYSAVTFKPLLLPLWVAVYRYREKTYQILVNGRTGRVAGYRPWSAWKIARLVALVLLVAAIIIFLVVYFGGGK